MKLLNKPREKKTSIKNSVGRILIVALLLILQFVWLTWMILMINLDHPFVMPFVSVLAIVLVIAINENEKNTSLKTPLMLIILMMPIAGVIFFILSEITSNTRLMRKRFKEFDDVTDPYLVQDIEVSAEIKSKDPVAASIFSYVSEHAGFPVFRNSDTVFFSDTPEAKNALLHDLRGAHDFIFLEYHAIEDKESFEDIYEVLSEKASEGLDVRVLYDDLGSFVFISNEFIRKLTARGIKCRVFNPMLPLFNLFFNNRDHRKIAVIDGVIGHTGGFNLANEYFHKTSPYGFWKDSGVRIEGAAVGNLTSMFLEMWNSVRKEKIETDISMFYPKLPVTDEPYEGFIAPYGDNPIDDEPVGENVYISLINASVDHVWFTTPYLILSDELKRALQLAAKRGIDVRIVTPGIPDKKMTYHVTRSYYTDLARSGVRIYEFTPGFIHAKQCICDDVFAVCGTINLDFRSLYHHFEDAVLMYNVPAIAEMRKDFEDVFSKSLDVTDRYTVRRRGVVRIARSLLRLAAPLL